MIAIKRMRGRLGVLIVGGLALQACSDSPQSAAPSVASIAAEGSIEPAATVGTAVSPAVVLIDDRNRPIAGTLVTFEVTAGRGSLAETSVATDASGRAVAKWTLGTTAGPNTVVARAPSGRTVTFNVTGRADVPSTVTAVRPVPEIAPVSGVLAPAVRVDDRHRNPVAGVTVEFTVTQGGGSVAVATEVTNVDGVASAGAWTVGGEQGDNEVQATVAGLAPVSFRTRAIAVSPDWAQIAKFGGDNTTCPVNSDGCRFSVRVTNVSGAPVAGEAILWRGVGGTTATTVTNAQGLSSSPNLGSNGTAGSYSQSAQLMTAGSEVTFGYQLVQGSGFNMELRYLSDTSPAVRAAFEQARSRWQQVITGKLSEFPLTGTNQVAENACGIDHPAINEVVDDLLILVQTVPIDGPGKVLGSAGPCMIRGSNNLPILGVIKLDSDDLAVMEANGTLRDVILHEMGHVIGLGTLWSRFALVQGTGSADPFYTGARAQPGFVLGGGSVLNGIPVENTGGAGTRDSHWRENRLGNELMTGYINSGGNPLSAMTVGSLMDLGYQVNFGAADGYSLPGAFGAQARAAETVHELVELPLPEPRRIW